MLVYFRFCCLLPAVRREGVDRTLCYYLEVIAYQKALLFHRNRYLGMAYSDIAHIMWEIFADARIFFSTPINKAGEFQRSTLSILRGNLTTGTIERQDVAPIKVQELIHNLHSRDRCRNQTPIP
jgi:hypothetical protein